MQAHRPYFLNAVVWLTMFMCTRLEEEEKLVTAEGLYKKALALDEYFQDATEALQKLQMRIQVSRSVRVY